MADEDDEKFGWLDCTEDELALIDRQLDKGPKLPIQPGYMDSEHESAEYEESYSENESNL